MNRNREADHGVAPNGIGSRLLVGAIGGVAGAALMFLLQAAMRGHLRRWGHTDSKPDSGIGIQAAFRLPEPASVVAGKLVPQATHSHSAMMASAIVVHAAFGAFSGMIYTGFARGLPFVAAGFGIPFGVGLWLAAAEFGLPVFGLSRWPNRSARTVQAFGFGAHLVYAATVEAASRLLLTNHNAAPAAVDRASGIEKITGSPNAFPQRGVS